MTLTAVLISSFISVAFGEGCRTSTLQALEKLAAEPPVSVRPAVPAESRSEYLARMNNRFSRRLETGVETRDDMFLANGMYQAPASGNPAAIQINSKVTSELDLQAAFSHEGHHAINGFKRAKTGTDSWSYAVLEGRGIMPMLSKPFLVEEISGYYAGALKTEQSARKTASSGEALIAKKSAYSQYMQGRAYLINSQRMFKQVRDRFNAEGTQFVSYSNGRLYIPLTLKEGAGELRLTTQRGLTTSEARAAAQVEVDRLIARFQAFDRMYQRRLKRLEKEIASSNRAKPKGST